ncbi:MAG TPA: TrkA family potassium uptake protein [Candidatus Limnocylindria bacterium]|nr:TrkA family potassium uptake protein [Candidatus Limnocylindria bacterium]
MKARQFLVIGAGRFGSAVATTLYNLGHEVVVIDRSEEEVEAIMSQVTHAAIGDATDEATLRKLGCSNFDAVIVAIGDNLEANILATVAAKSVGAKHVISKVASSLAARVLAKVGADEVIRPEHDMGIRVAKQLANPSILDAFNLGTAHGVIEIEIRERLAGSLESLRLRNRFGVQVIAVNRAGTLEIGPSAGFELKPGDKAVLIGSNEAIERIREYLSE